MAEKSLVDQILDNLFTKISNQKEFDPTVIAKLQELVANGNFAKANRIIESIKPIPEDKQ